MIHRAFLILATIGGCIASGPNLLRAQTFDTTGVVFYAGHLDPDGVVDTLFAARRPASGFLPLRIHWGYTGGQSRKVTRFRYPSWANLNGSTSIVRVNADTLRDLLIFMWGRVPGPPAERDTVRRLVIFGQSMLKDVNQINVHQLALTQNTPFHAVELAEGRYLTNRRVRDYSGIPSWTLEPLAIDVTDTSQAPRTNHAVRDSGAVLSAIVRPNPAGASAVLEFTGFAPGDYVVRLVSSAGVVVRSEPVRVTGDLHRKTLDIEGLPSGAYDILVTIGGVSRCQTRIVVAH